MTEAVPTYFVQTKFKSFSRQLTGWGFKRLYQPGADFSCYYHECFLRGLPKLTWLMKRVSPDQGKHTPFTVEQEPDFYLISRMRPLPNLTTILDHDDNCANIKTPRQAESTSAMIPTLQSVPHLPASNDWSNCVQNTMMPLAQANLSENSAAVATTKLPITAMPHIPTRMHLLPNPRPIFDHDDCKNIKTPRQVESASAMIPISPLVSRLPVSSDWSNWASLWSDLSEGPASSCNSSYPTNYTPTSADTPYTNPGEDNSYSTPDQLQPSYHQPEITKSDASMQNERDDHEQESHQGGETRNAFTDVFGSFIDNFQF